MAEELPFTQEDMEFLQRTKIFVGTPAYGEQVSVYYARSMMKLFAFAAAHNLPVTFKTLGNESLITRARNSIVRDFITSDSNLLMFIDADISFDHLDVFRLALHRRDVVAAAYPTKGLAWERTANLETPEEVRNATINYVINLPKTMTEKTDDSGMIPVDLHNGLLEVLDAGTGFMMISRNALELLIAAYGKEIEYKSDLRTVDDASGFIEKDKDVTHWAIFDTSIEIETERYLSEDYTFCRRWQSIEGKIWIDPAVVLTHHGSFAYRGYPIC